MRYRSRGFVLHSVHVRRCECLARWHAADVERLGKRDEVFEFLTNNFALASSTIAHIYKARWQIEVFFKWLKQNLKIKSFLGTSPNAVMAQVWTAMCYYLLLTYIKYQTKYRQSIFYLHRIVREMLMERTSLIDLLNLNEVRLDRLKCQEQQLLFQL